MAGAADAWGAVGFALTVHRLRLPCAARALLHGCGSWYSGCAGTLRRSS
jgi:hypothetical protein